MACVSPDGSVGSKVGSAYRCYAHTVSGVEGLFVAVFPWRRIGSVSNNGFSCVAQDGSPWMVDGLSVGVDLHTSAIFLAQRKWPEAMATRGCLSLYGNRRSGYSSGYFTLGNGDRPFACCRCCAGLANCSLSDGALDSVGRSSQLSRAIYSRCL